MSISATKRTTESAELPEQYSSNTDRLSALFISQPRQESTSSSSDFSGSKRSTVGLPIEQISKTQILSSDESSKVFQTTTTTSIQTGVYTLIFESNHKRILTAEEKDLLSQSSYYFETLFNVNGFRESSTQAARFESIPIEAFEDLLLILKNPQQDFNLQQLCNILSLKPFFEIAVITPPKHFDLVCKTIDQIDKNNPSKEDLNLLTAFINKEIFCYDNIKEKCASKAKEILSNLCLDQLEHYIEFIAHISKTIDEYLIAYSLGSFIYKAFKYESCLQALRKLNLETLDFSCITNFNNEDLEKCAEFFPDLNKLIIKGNQLTSLNPLKNCSKLEFLDLRDCSNISSLEPLAEAPLTHLYLSGCQKIKNLSPLKKAYLRVLDLAYCTEVDLQFVYTQINLEHLNVSNCVKRDPFPIFSNLRKLVTLNFSGWKEFSLSAGEKTQLEAEIRACNQLKQVTIRYVCGLDDLFPESVEVIT